VPRPGDLCPGLPCQALVGKDLVGRDAADLAGILAGESLGEQGIRSVLDRGDDRHPLFQQGPVVRDVSVEQGSRCGRIGPFQVGRLKENDVSFALVVDRRFQPVAEGPLAVWGDAVLPLHRGLAPGHFGPREEPVSLHPSQLRIDLRVWGVPYVPHCRLGRLGQIVAGHRPAAQQREQSVAQAHGFVLLYCVGGVCGRSLAKRDNYLHR